MWGKDGSGGALDSSVRQPRSNSFELAGRIALSGVLVARDSRRFRPAMELATIAPTVMRPEYTRNSNGPTTTNNTSETAASPYSDTTKSREQGSRASPAVVDLNQSRSLPILKQQRERCASGGMAGLGSKHGPGFPEARVAGFTRYRCVRLLL